MSAPVQCGRNMDKAVSADRPGHVHPNGVCPAQVPENAGDNQMRTGGQTNLGAGAQNNFLGDGQSEDWLKGGAF